jgi:hypothetical protein
VFGISGDGDLDADAKLVTQKKHINLAGYGRRFYRRAKPALLSESLHEMLQVLVLLTTTTR